jgi:hypothetical protein
MLHEVREIPRSHEKAITKTYTCQKQLYAIRGIAAVADLFPHNELYALLFVME